MYKQILINAKLPEVIGRSPLRRRRSAWDCTAIHEVEGEGEEAEGEEEGGGGGGEEGGGGGEEEEGGGEEG